MYFNILYSIELLELTWFILGGGGGIGRAICHMMAREGATVAAADVNINNAQFSIANLTGKYNTKCISNQN